MLNATVQELGDSTVLRCQGRIVIGDAYSTLRNAVLDQRHTKVLVLDLAQVDRIDAGGLGVLLGIRQWAYSRAIGLRLMNVMNQVEQVLELTKLDRVFKFCSVRDLFHLLRQAAMAPWSVDQPTQRMLKANCNRSVKGKTLLLQFRGTTFLPRRRLACERWPEFPPTRGEVREPGGIGARRSSRLAG
jgi:anti-sigma B factor antagonist